jgi:hypothetical protein
MFRGQASLGRPKNRLFRHPTRMTTFPVAWRARSRSSPSFAASSGRTWLTCGRIRPARHRSNSRAKLSVRTEGRRLA